MTATETTYDPTVPHWRQTKGGYWVVCGSPDKVRAGEWCEVVKKDGETKKVHIDHIGTEFDTDDGTTLVYGYLEPFEESD